MPTIVSFLAASALYLSRAFLLGPAHTWHHSLSFLRASHLVAALRLEAIIAAEVRRHPVKNSIFSDQMDGAP